MTMVNYEVTFGERLRLERTRRHIHLADAAAAAQEMLPPSMSMSREKVNPLHVAALAQVYGIKLKDLHPPSAEATRVVGALVKASSRCTALPAAA